MHSALNRLQTAFGFFTTVLFTTAALVALSDILVPRTPSASIVPGEVTIVQARPHAHSRSTTPIATLRFNLDADLSSLFTWNTKSLFIYVTAEWTNPTPSPSHNPSLLAKAKGAPAGPVSAVIWDSIITTPSSDFLSTLGPIAKRKLRASSQGKTIDPSRGLISLKNQRAKYKLHAPVPLAELQNVTLKLHYNVQPWVGFLSWDVDETIASWSPIDGASSEPFDFPAIKAKKSETKKATA